MIVSATTNFISAITGYSNARQAVNEFKKGEVMSGIANLTFATALSVTTASALAIAALKLSTQYGMDETFGFQRPGSDLADELVSHYFTPVYNASGARPHIEKACEVATPYIQQGAEIACEYLQAAKNVTESTYNEFAPQAEAAFTQFKDKTLPQASQYLGNQTAEACNATRHFATETLPELGSAGMEMAGNALSQGYQFFQNLMFGTSEASATADTIIK